MRRLMVSEFITIDGVVEAPGGEPGHPHTGWVFPFFGPDLEKYKGQEIAEAESMLLGRVTYEDFATAFAPAGPADRINAMSKYVVSSTLEDPLGWDNATRLEGELVPAIEKLKQGEGGPILVHGSMMLAQALLAANLVDDLRLMVFPVVVGGGRSIFPTGFELSKFTLTSTETVLPNVLVHTYARSG